MGIIFNTLWAYRNKVTNKMFGIVRMPAQGVKKGYALLSYMTEPFTLAPWERESTRHSNYWECKEMARLLSQKGYVVDVINWDNTLFRPKIPYSICIDTSCNLKRLSDHLPASCIKIMHIISSHWKFQNNAELARIANLKKRRGIELAPRRQTPPSENIEIADFVEGFGNTHSFKTFEFARKHIVPIPISVVCEYPFFKDRDLVSARKRFLWIGGGGCVLKGLDIVLESFAGTPELELFVCGPVKSEKDFYSAYRKELEDMPHIHFMGRIDVTSEVFKNILKSCIGVIHASASEGGGGASIQAMHGGLIPIATKESTVPLGDFGILLNNPSVSELQTIVRKISRTSPEELARRSEQSWSYARTHHTRHAFSQAYSRFLDTVCRP